MSQDSPTPTSGPGDTNPSTQFLAEDPDHPSPYAKKAIVASALGYAMDGFDLLILGFALTAISLSLGLNQFEAGSLATITLLGAVVGGIGFGIMSDRIGRVKVLTYSIVLFAVFTGLTALAQDYWQIAIFRFIAGLGLGGEFGIGMTLAAESWPAKLRARATAYVALGWQGGVLLAALVSAPIITLWGWRGLFALGALPALGAYMFRRQLEEPEKFVKMKSKTEKRGFPLGMLFADGPTSRATLGITVLCSVQNFGYYGIMIWLPTYLSTQFGYTLTKSAVWTAVTVLGMAIGIFVFGQLADRIGRRPSFWIFQLGAVISVLTYSQLTSPGALLIGGAIMGVFVNGMLGGYGALMAEIYPTPARATAQNVLFNIGRGVGGFGPLVMAALASQYSFGFAIALLAFIYVLDMVAMLVIPERRGTELID